MSSLTSLNQIGSQAGDICTPSCSWKINIKYIPLKLIYFCYMAGQGGSVVFRSLFIKHLGMSTTQNGIIWAIDRIFGVFVPPILGGISDKSGKPRATIMWLLLSGGIACASLCFVPFNRNREQDQQKHCFSSCSFQISALGISCTVTSLNQSCVNYEEFEDNLPLCFHHNSSLTSSDFSSSNNATEFHHDSFRIICKKRTRQFQNTILTKNLSKIPSWQDFQNMAFDFCNCSADTSFVDSKMQDVYGVTFWLLLLLIILSSISVFGVGTLMDSFVMGSLAEKEKHSFGHQRLWGGIGFGVSTLLVGYIKDVISEKVSDPTSNVIFYPFFFSPGIFWIVLCIVLGGFSQHSVRKENVEKIRFKALKILVINPRIFAFIVFTITLGINMAVCEIYMFWLAEQRLQANSTILAAAIAFSTCFEIVAYLASGCLVRQFGSRIVMTIGLVTLGTRLLLYTLVTKPWHLLLAEVLRGLGWPTAWIAVCHHISVVSPPGLAATTLGLVQATTFGVGYGVGALLGGFLFQKYDGDIMFQIMFALVMVVSLLYFIFYRSYDWWSKRRAKKNSQQEVEKLRKNNAQQKDVNHNVGEFGDCNECAEKKKIFPQGETAL